MKTSIDTSVLLDIRDEGSVSSLRALAACSAEGPAIISTIVYAELCGRFPTRLRVDAFLSELQIETDSIGSDAAHEAGRIFAAYRAAGGARGRILPDFLIGAHATIQAERLLTRDRGFYRQYFRGLRIVEP